MSDNAEKRATDQILLVQALDRYIDDVVAMNHGTRPDETPIIMKDSFTRSIQANIEYHQMMADIHAKNGEIVMSNLHKTKLAIYRAIMPK